MFERQSQAPTMTWALIGILGFIAALTPLAIDMYLPAMPTITEAFDTTTSAVQHTLSIFSIGFALGQLIVGPISDSVGRRPVMLMGVFLFAVTSIFCALATDIDELNAWRFLQGFAGAASGVMISTLVKDMFARDEFSRIMSFIVLVMTFAPLVAPLLGGYIAKFFGWRAIFWVLALMGLCSIFIVWRRIPETLAVEHRQPVSIVRAIRQYIKILSDPTSLAMLACGAFSFACLFCFLVSASFVYIDSYGVSMEDVGFLFAFNVVALMLLTSINGRKVTLKGAPYMLRLGLTIQFVGALLLLPSLYFDNTIWLVVVPCMMIIGATSMVGSNLMAVFLTRHHSIAGTASSMIGSFRFGVGAAVGAISTVLSFDVQINMALTMVVCAALSMTSFRVYRWSLKKTKA